jgi:hypothetical protein
MSITVTVRSNAWTVFVHLKYGVAGSNRTRGMDVCVCLFCVCLVLCVGSGLATGWSPPKWSYRLCKWLRNWKSGQGPTKGCRTIDEWMNCGKGTLQDWGLWVGCRNANHYAVTYNGNHRRGRNSYELYVTYVTSDSTFPGHPVICFGI